MVQSGFLAAPSRSIPRGSGSCCAPNPDPRSPHRGLAVWAPIGGDGSSCRQLHLTQQRKQGGSCRIRLCQSRFVFAFLAGKRRGGWWWWWEDGRCCPRGKPARSLRTAMPGFVELRPSSRLPGSDRNGWRIPGTVVPSPRSGPWMRRKRPKARRRGGDDEFRTENQPGGSPTAGAGSLDRCATAPPSYQPMASFLIVNCRNLAVPEVSILCGEVQRQAMRLPNRSGLAVLACLLSTMKYTVFNY
jgi:hypothetical protein